MTALRLLLHRANAQRVGAFVSRYSVTASADVSASVFVSQAHCGSMRLIYGSSRFAGLHEPLNTGQVRAPHARGVWRLRLLSPSGSIGERQ